jgi:hypothetical protein
MKAFAVCGTAARLTRENKAVGGKPAPAGVQQAYCGFNVLCGKAVKKSCWCNDIRTRSANMPPEVDDA